MSAIFTPASWSFICIFSAPWTLLGAMAPDPIVGLAISAYRDPDILS